MPKTTFTSSLALSLKLGEKAAQISTRINGIDGLIEVAKIAMRERGASEEVILSLSALGEAGFKQLKSYRDAIMHARIIDVDAAIAITPHHRGKFNEVLINNDALHGGLCKTSLYAKRINCVLQYCDEAFCDRLKQED